MLPSGILTEIYVIEQPVATRNASGESVTTWERVGDVYGSYEALSFNEAQRLSSIGGNISARVRIRYRPGITSAMRLRWASRGDRILWIAGVVERGRSEELDLAVEEKAS